MALWGSSAALRVRTRTRYGQGARCSQPATGKPEDVIGVVCVIASRPAVGAVLELGYPPLQAQHPAAHARRPLVAAGHDAGAPRFVRPPGGGTGSHLLAEGRARQQRQDLAAPEGTACRWRQTIGEPGDDARAGGPVWTRRGDRETGRLEGGGEALAGVRAGSHDRAIPQRRAPLGGRDHRTNGFARFGAFVGHGHDRQRTITGEGLRKTRGRRRLPHGRDGGQVACVGTSRVIAAHEAGGLRQRSHRDAARRDAARDGHEGVGSARKEGPHQRLLCHIEVVQAEEDDGRQGRGRRQVGRGREERRVVHEPQAVQFRAVHRVERLEVGRLRPRLAGEGQGGPPGGRRDARLAQVAEGGCKRPREVRTVGDRREVGKRRRGLGHEPPHQTFLRLARERPAR